MTPGSAGDAGADTTKHLLVFNSAVSVNSASIYSAELYPTSIRSTVMGLQGQLARAGSIAAPFILLLGQQMGSATFLPFIIYGATSLLAGMMLMAMPETLGAPMPETMEVREGGAADFWNS